MRQATVEKRSKETVDGSMMSAELMGAMTDPSYTHAIHLVWRHIMVFSNTVKAMPAGTNMCAWTSGRVSIGRDSVSAMPRAT
jgi:hypothetical protein